MDGNNRRCLLDGRNAKTRKDCIGENPYQSEKGALAWDRQLCLGHAVNERLEAVARNSAGEKSKQKDEWNFSGHVARRISER